MLQLTEIKFNLRDINDGLPPIVFANVSDYVIVFSRDMSEWKRVRYIRWFTTVEVDKWQENNDLYDCGDYPLWIDLREASR